MRKLVREAKKNVMPTLKSRRAVGERSSRTEKILLRIYANTPVVNALARRKGAILLNCLNSGCMSLCSSSRIKMFLKPFKPL